MEIICSTNRLYLKKFSVNTEDAENVLAMNSKPQVLQYLHELALKTLDDAFNILTTNILPQYEKKLGRWSVHLKSNDAFTGWCGLKQRPERNNEIDLGYRFLPEYWGKGIATEAATACLHYAFYNLKLEKVHACAHINNTASWRILEKAGMQFTHEEVIDSCPVKCYIAYNSNSLKD